MARVTLVECIMPRNPVLLVEDSSTRFFYGVPRPSVFEEHRDVSTIIVSGDTGEAAEAIRRLGMSAGDRITVYMSFRNPAKTIARVHGMKLVEVYSETVLGAFTVRPVLCGLIVYGKGVVLSPPCMPHVLYTILVSLYPELEGATIVAVPDGSFEQYVRRLESYGARRIVVPECSTRGQWLGLELAGATILREGESIEV